MQPRRIETQPNIGIFGIGLAAYWPQFPGLHDRLTTYLRSIEALLEAWGTVVSGGLVDSAEAAARAAERLGQAQVDLLFVYAATYATSSVVLPIVQQVRAPVILLNLQPTAALDYERITTEEWLANCSACCVPELGGALTRAGISYKVVSGALEHDERAWGEIEAWCRAAGVARAVRRARFGFLGHTYPGMLDMYSDFTAISGQLGSNIDVLEIDDLVARVRAATPEQVRAKVGELRETFAFADAGIDPIAAEIELEDLEWSARVAVGLDALVQDYDLSALAYYYRGLEGNENEQVTAGMIAGNSLLTARGIPCSGEGDLKNAVAMFVMDRLGAGGSFTEIYAMDLVESFLLLGHDGPMHLAIAEGRPVLRKLKLYHGKRGFGVAVECKVKQGAVSILGVTQQQDGRLKFLTGEGESIPGPTFKIGNTNSRIRFRLDPASFVNRWTEEGPTHHCALGIGHQGEMLRNVGHLLGVMTMSVA
ncbi:MAG: L-fucose/L-arabinose isomerase family protein [Ktedonobacteraceae bacterium]|nr:L-fucose/L-arabinose isomerase family protein [Ktedonobacteraceae bacterium]MBO0793310.1 L-fucose/L-arabinose isomerase family protein [Ktedonobacteraceae bacterium]